MSFTLLDGRWSVPSLPPVPGPCLSACMCWTCRIPNNHVGRCKIRSWPQSGGLSARALHNRHKKDSASSAAPVDLSFGPTWKLSSWPPHARAWPRSDETFRSDKWSRSAALCLDKRCALCSIAQVMSSAGRSGWKTIAWIPGSIVAPRQARKLHDAVQGLQAAILPFATPDNLRTDFSSKTLASPQLNGNGYMTRCCIRTDVGIVATIPHAVCRSRCQSGLARIDALGRPSRRKMVFCQDSSVDLRFCPYLPPTVPCEHEQTRAARIHVLRIVRSSSLSAADELFANGNTSDLPGCLRMVEYGSTCRVEPASAVICWRFTEKQQRSTCSGDPRTSRNRVVPEICHRGIIWTGEPISSIAQRWIG